MQLNEGKMSIVSDAVPEIHPASPQHAVLDDAQIGDINGAFGTIRRDDHGPRHNWRARASTLLAILGPGLIVMVGDNDAGAFGTYTQAGQNYGTSGSGPRDIPAGATRGRERIKSRAAWGCADDAFGRRSYVPKQYRAIPSEV
jgi:hypothetical protein